MLKRLLCLFLLLPLSIILQGQCMTVPESLRNLVAASPLVVEGKVRSQESFWDTENKNIYTVNEIEVFKIFQGIRTIQTVHVVTRGGVVGLEMDRVSNALELEVGEMGLFMLQTFSGKLPIDGSLHRPTEGILGFIRYDLVIGTAQGVYDSYSDIPTELYNTVTALTGLSILDIGLWDSEDARLSGEPSVERSIVSDQEGSSSATFEVHAGVGDLLTLTGADFGDETGSVLFPDANSGGRKYIAALGHQIKEWSDGRIVLEVPYRAGTGKVRIDKANGESLIGEDVLPIGYDHINVQYTDNTGRKAYETQLTSDNGKGGYDFQFESDFAENAGASQAFISLIETWACTTGVNFQIGEVTNVDEDANDGINIVRFDNGDELGGRTLAYARSRYRGCYQGETIKWYVNEIEVVVNDDYDWYYGDGQPGNSQFDFETVMLHEIGHTQQLGHVINDNEVMHFAVGPGQQKRSLSFIDTIGGEFVTDKSTAEAVCGRNPMEEYGGCCESMAIVNQASDITLCNDDTTATFAFEVDFAEMWQWQVRKDEIWTDLDDDSNYSGTDTAELTVARSDIKQRQYRCIASNVCGESLTSDTVDFAVVQLELSAVVVENETCSYQMGRIRVEFNDHPDYDGVEISLDGGSSYEFVFDSASEQNEITGLSAGPYEIWARWAGSLCDRFIGNFSIQNNRSESANCPNKEEENPDKPETPDSETPNNPETPETPDNPESPETSDNPETPENPENPESPDHSDNPETPETPESPDNPESPETPDMPDNPEKPENPEGKEEPETTDKDSTEDITVKLYPNPTTERIFIQGKASGILRFQLFSARGVLVQDVVPQRENEDTLFMDVAHPQAGVYTLHIITEKNNILRRVIIQ